MNKKAAHFDTVMSWFVFTIYALFIFFLTTGMCKCVSSCGDEALSYDSSLNVHAFDSLQASEELAGYLRTPLPFENWAQLKRSIDRLPPTSAYKQRVHIGVKIGADHLDRYVSHEGGAIVTPRSHAFLEENSELYKKPPDKDFLTYGDFITRLSSYKNNPEAVFAFRTLTSVMFTKRNGRNESCDPLTEENSYTMPFIFLYFNQELNEIESPSRLSMSLQDWAKQYENPDSFQTNHRDMYLARHGHDCAYHWRYGDANSPCWSTGYFTRDESINPEERCSRRNARVHEGFKILPGNGSTKIVVTLLTQPHYREDLKPDYEFVDYR